LSALIAAITTPRLARACSMVAAIEARGAGRRRNRVVHSHRLDVQRRRDRHEELRREHRHHAVEPARCDADDRVGGAANVDEPANHIGRRAELAGPVAVRHHHDPRRARRVVGRHKRPPDRGRNAEHREVVAGDDLAHRQARPVVEVHRRHHRAVADDAVEHVVARLQIAVVEVGRGAVLDAAARITREHVDEPVDGGNRQRLEQQGVHDGEQRRVEADADGERRDRDQRKRRALAEPTQRETDVGEQRGEQGVTIIIRR
jgi:hypothetical protein